MKHLIICREYLPAPFPPGGIGTYVVHLSKLLAERGDTVHIITQLWLGAAKRIETKCNGKLIIHRVPLDDWESFLVRSPIPDALQKEVKGLFQSGFPPQCFSWQASLLAEQLVEEEGIDVIEAQDYEAPLYYFQLRRSLGLGPKRTPPCIVHLHSPTEFIAQHNDWDLSLPDVLAAKRLEDYSIAAADALLCPSQYFARQAEIHYGLAAGSIKVIPLPIGENPVLDRTEAIWEHGNICYVGRLERRKGVIEWIDAAISVADEYPSTQFEFVGTNCLGNFKMSGEEFVERRIPEHLQERFHFRGRQNRSSLPRFLSQARIAVVPSRWENFPNTCVEAMCSGLPVIASPEGGMAEMIRDGQTGWISSSTKTESLAVALKQALETSAKEIAEMGRAASFDIHQMCDNRKIVDAHLDFRTQLMQQGAKRSLFLPTYLSNVESSPFDTPARRIAFNNSAQGIGLIVTCFNNGQQLDNCLKGLAEQTQKPGAVVIVDNDSTDEYTLKILNQARWDGWQVIENRNRDLVSAKNAGIQTIKQLGLNLLGLAFLDSSYQMQNSFIETCASVLQKCPDVGLVSCWSQDSETGEFWINPCPSFPYQWLSNEVAPFAVIRTDALDEVGCFRPVMSQGYEDWDLFNAVIASGWIAVTVPKILVNNWAGQMPSLRAVSVHAHGKMRREMLERFPHLVARDAQQIALLAEPHNTRLEHGELPKIQEQDAVSQLMFHVREALHLLSKVKLGSFQIQVIVRSLASQVVEAIGSRVFQILGKLKRQLV